MKNDTLKELLQNYPIEVAHQEVIDFENFEERLSAVDYIAVNRIEVDEGFIAFIPDNEPPQLEEIYCWIWAIRPDLSKDLQHLELSDDLSTLLNSYLDQDMGKFYDYMS